ncbi:MAG: DNA alkylation repair protein [Acholeplasmatales bacterium]
MKRDLLKYLDKNKDVEYKNFISRLIPNLDKDFIIGVCTPILRSIAKEIIENKKEEEYLNKLPHEYYEQYQIHSILLSQKMEYNKLITHLEAFLPYINNWATCDTLIPKIDNKNLEDFYKHILIWINSNHEYTVRFGIYMIMKNYLNNLNIDKYLKDIIRIKSDKYYINMMISWTLAEALWIDYDKTIKYLENKNLNKFVQNKAIQKAIESRKLSSDIKDYLKTLKTR